MDLGLNSSSFSVDLIIDGVSFRRLPDRLDAKREKNAGNKSFNYASGSYRDGNSSGPNSGANSRESSFEPWECTRCTLINKKPLAPICEACGHPKPEISGKFESISGHFLGTCKMSDLD